MVLSSVCKSGVQYPPLASVLKSTCLAWASYDMIFPHLCVVYGHGLQNPEVVALKEDIKRTGKKLKLWERELEDRKTKLADQHSKVAKLEQDLEQVNAGEGHLAWSCTPEKPPVWLVAQWLPCPQPVCP